PDGLRWTRDPANPIFTGSWTEDVFVLKRNGRYLMFAEGVKDVAHQLVSPHREHWTDLGRLDVRTTDGQPIRPGPSRPPAVHWEKYPGNPIVKNNCSSPILVAGPEGDRLYTMHPDVRVFRVAPGAK